MINIILAFFNMQNIKAAILICPLVSKNSYERSWGLCRFPALSPTPRQQRGAQDLVRAGNWDLHSKYSVGCWTKTHAELRFAWHYRNDCRRFGREEDEAASQQGMPTTDLNTNIP